ncbi:orotate phosphoribosyltransferase, partial [Acinetobacter baumannii]
SAIQEVQKELEIPVHALILIQYIKIDIKIL